MPGSHRSTNLSLNNSTYKNLLNEPQVVRLQKEVDGYTRKVEHERRRLQNIDENFEIVLKELNDKKQSIVNLTKMQQTTEYKKKLNEIKNLEHQLDQAVVKYNEIVAQNNHLRQDIDVIRRERTTFLDIFQNLKQKFKKTEDECKEVSLLIEKRKNKSIQAHNQIFMLKSKNEEQKQNYQIQFDQLQKQMKDERKAKDSNKIFAKQQDQKIENFEANKILKRRLQKIILNNKEKVRVIEKYQKNMHIIDEAFNQIKEGSGITDIDEIASTFIKSEEQNYSLYNYVDILTQDIDLLEEENRDLEEKITQQRIENDFRQKILKGTPQEEKSKKRIEKIIQEKEKQLEKLQQDLQQISPIFQQLINDLKDSKVVQTDQLKYTDYSKVQLTDTYVFQYMSELEALVNDYINFKTKLNNNFLTDPLLLEELPEKEFEKNKTTQNLVIEKEDLNGENLAMLINPQQLRQIAAETVERKLNQSSLNFDTDDKNILAQGKKRF